MKITKLIGSLAFALFAMASATSCSDDKTYAELLTDETHYTNAFLANQRVVGEVPADSVFEWGPDAPYYRLDEDGNLYMQVVEPGTKGDKAQYNDLIYFRFTRYPLSTYANGEFGAWEGNDDALGGNYSFRFGNFELQSSYNFGEGIQVPLQFLPVDAVVNIVIKSQQGWPNEMSNVQPYLYSVRYFRPKI